MPDTLSPGQAEAPRSTISPDPHAAPGDRKDSAGLRIVAASAAALVIVAALGLGIYALLQPGAPTQQIRDVFIIVVSLETLVIGAALIVLIVQVASLINLLQNEVRPILQATSETVHTLRGTADFLGESVVEPIIKLNGYLASMQRVLELMGIKRK